MSAADQKWGGGGEEGNGTKLTQLIVSYDARRICTAWELGSTTPWTRMTTLSRTLSGVGEWLLLRQPLLPSLSSPEDHEQATSSTPSNSPELRRAEVVPYIDFE